MPVVFMTASNDSGLAQTVLKAGGGAPLLRKPFSKAELLDAILEAVRNKPSGST